MKSFLLSFILIIAVISAAKWLLNDGEMKNITAFFCSLVLIFSLFSHKNGEKLPVFNYKTADFYTETASFPHENSLIEASSIPIIAAILTENGINYSKIELKTNKTQENGIIISKVIVYSSFNDTEKIKEVIINNTSAKSVEVISD